MWRKSKPYLMLLPSLSVVVLLFFGGLSEGVAQSLGYFPAAGQSDISLTAYRKLFAWPDFWASLWLTLRIAFLSTLAAGILGGLVAVGLFMIEKEGARKGIRLCRWLFQLPLMVPHLVGAYLMALFLMQSGWISRLLHGVGLIRQISDFPVVINDPFGWGIIFTYAWKEGPFVALMVFPVLMQVQTDWLEVAQVCGATKMQFFKEIIVPLALPPWLSALFIIFSFTFSGFEVPYLLGVTYPKMLPVFAYDLYTGGGLTAVPEAMAVNVVLAGITALLGLVAYSLSRRWDFNEKRGW